MGYIYKITNLITQQIYIGKTTKTIQDRFKQHQKNSLDFNKKTYLYNAMRKYGIQNFIITQLEECDNSILNNQEKYWIKQLNSKVPNGYNMTDGGDGGNTWINNPHKLETIEKIKKANLGKKRTTQQKYKMHLAQQKRKKENPNSYINFIKAGIKHQQTSEQKQKLHNLFYNKFYKEIDKYELLEDLKYSGLSEEKICKKYNITPHTLITRCQRYFNCNPKDLRIVSSYRTSKTYSKEMQKHLSTIRSLNMSGNKNPLYKQIDKEQLYSLIQQKKTAEEMCTILNISKPTLYKKIKENFNKTLREMRKDVK